MFMKQLKQLNRKIQDTWQIIYRVNIKQLSSLLIQLRRDKNFNKK